MNPYITEIMLREKRKDFLREAERQRLVAQYNRMHPTRSSRLITGLGDLLIRLGSFIKNRYGNGDAFSQPLHKPCGSS